MDIEYGDWNMLALIWFETGQSYNLADVGSDLIWNIQRFDLKRVSGDSFWNMLLDSAYASAELIWNMQ